jgi:FeS assembly SUF system regulator
MIRITKETDHAIVLLSHLASRQGDRPCAARDLARWSGVTLPMASKILKSLARAGVLESIRGVKGGYRLADRPERISVGDVIRALEGPIGMTECSTSPGSCEQEAVCPVRINWQRLSDSVRDVLEKIPLSEMITPSDPALIRIGEAGG